MIGNFIQKRRLECIICLFLAASSLLIYYQSTQHDFVTYDDELYVIKNPHIKAGLTSESTIWAFTTGYAANWHPLTWLSHMLDFQLYSLNPMGHHWTNLQIHIVNTVLLFLFLKWVTGTIWRSAFVSVLFAVHPLHVESVAWVSERKDVLCALFWILSMWAYVGYVRQPKKTRYLLLLMLFTLGLMSKPMIVTLPFVLLLFDFWPLSRFQVMVYKHQVSTFKVFVRLVWEKFPLFVLAAISCFITFFVQQHGGAVASIESFPLKARVANAIVAYTSYIVKLIWPLNLVVLYPLREWNPGQVLISGVLLMFLSALAVRTWRRCPYLSMGWFWYLGTLVPVIGLVQVGAQSMADRYTYIPSIGLFMIVSWGVTDISAKWRWHRSIVILFSGVALVSLTICAWFQVGYWKNGITLFKHTVEVTHNNSMAYCGLGRALDRHEKYDDAIKNYVKALELNPNYAEAHYEIGVTLEKQGNSIEALRHYFEALQIKPNYAKVHNNIGVILSGQGKIEDAIYHYKKALQIDPNYPVAYYNLGVIFSNHGKIKDAILQYRNVLRLSPNMTQALYRLSWILSTYEDEKYRNGEKAVNLAEKLCKITGNGQPLALDALAAAYAETGRFDDAVLTAKKGLELSLLSGPEELILGLKERLQLYQMKRAYRQSFDQKNES